MKIASVTDRLTNIGTDKWGLFRESRRRVSQGCSIIELAIGEPDMPMPARITEAAIRSLRAGRINYAAARGEGGVVDAIAAKYAARSGRPITAENVIFLPGTQAALFVAMQVLAETGDEVLVGDPLYATYEGVIRSTGADMVLVPLKSLHNFHLLADDLEAQITPRSRAVLLNSPHNPTGATLSAKEIAQIVAVCKRNNLWIISDEVYETFAYGTQFASPFDHPDGADRTLVVSSISKSHLLPGFRSGWCVGPEAIIARMVLLSESMFFGSPPFLQDATAMAVNEEFPECAAMAGHFANRAGILPQVLAGAMGLHCTPPEGGMFCMVDVSGTGTNGDTFAWRLLDEENVAVMPGSSFGRETFGHIRVSLSADPAILREAAGRMARLAARLRAEAA